MNVNADKLITALEKLRDEAKAEAEQHRAGTHEWVLAKGQAFGLDDAISAVRDAQLAKLRR